MVTVTPLQPDPTKSRIDGRVNENVGPTVSSKEGLSDMESDHQMPTALAVFRLR